MPKRSKANATIIPPPVGGWNTKDPLVGMDPLYAVEMVNFFPGFGSVDLRGGSTIHSSFNGVPGVPGMLGALSYGNVNKMIAGDTFGNVYDVTTSSSSKIDGGLTPFARYGYCTQFRDRIFIKDDSAAFDVYSWTGSGNMAAAGFTGPAGDDKLLGPMWVYKNRIYFAQRGASANHLPEYYYGAVDAVTGALTHENMISVFTLGGYIMFGGRATRAKNFSEDELMVLVTSRGEVLVYSGSYPGDSTWSLIGRYYIPPPNGEKCFFYQGSTLMIITKAGVFGIDAIMGGTFSQPGAGFQTGDISANVKDQFALSSTGSLGPLSGVFYPKGNKIIVACNSATASAYQLVMNSVTGAWCKFTGWACGEMIVFQDNLYYYHSNSNTSGSNVVIMKADTGYFDENPATPAAILTRDIKLRPAYHDFGNATLEKQFVAAIPYLYMSEGLTLTMDIDVNYANVAATQVITPDTSDTSYKLYTPKIGLKGYGEVGSLRIDGTVTTKRISIQALKVLWNDGDVI